MQHKESSHKSLDYDSFLGTEDIGCKKKEKRKETHKNKVVPDMPSHMFNEFSLFGK